MNVILSLVAGLFFVRSIYTLSRIWIEKTHKKYIICILLDVIVAYRFFFWSGTARGILLQVSLIVLVELLYHIFGNSNREI